MLGAMGHHIQYLPDQQLVVRFGGLVFVNIVFVGTKLFSKLSSWGLVSVFFRGRVVNGFGRGFLVNSWGFGFALLANRFVGVRVIVGAEGVWFVYRFVGVRVIVGAEGVWFVYRFVGVLTYVTAISARYVTAVSAFGFS